MSLSASDVGSRVVVRRLLPDERGPSGGQAMTDVIGVLEEYDDDHLVVRRKDDTTVAIDRDLVVAAKIVPARPPTRARAATQTDGDGTSGEEV